MEKAKSDLMAIANSSQSKLLEQLTTSHKEEMESMKAKVEQQPASEVCVCVC